MKRSLALCGLATVLLHALGCCYTYGQKYELGMIFTRHPQPFVAPLGDEVLFECILNLAAEKFAWRHRPIGFNKWTTLVPDSSVGGKTSKFTVNFDNENKAGDYRCVAYYGASALASDAARLTQARIDKFTDKSNVNLKIAPGNNVPIICPLPYSIPEAVIQFFKNGNPIFNASLTGSKTMLIENANPLDSGSYHCLANNYITSETYASNYKTILLVDKNSTVQAPYFIKQPQIEYKILRGRDVTLECFAAGNPIPQVTWSKLGSSLPVRSQSSPLGLTITNVQPNDRGEYDCVWSNQYNRIKSVIILTVVEIPTILKPPKLPTVPEGGELEVFCNATGYPAPEFEWLINGDTFVPSKSIEIKRNTLFISPIEKKHAGVVQCVAGNDYGSHSSYSLLRVGSKSHVTGSKSKSSNGAPSSSSGYRHTRGGSGRRRRKDGKHKGTAILVPPNQPNVTRLSDVSVMVRWSVPENHGLPIQFFKVQYRELGNQKSSNKQAKWMTANTEIPSHIRSFEVGDLTPNQTYRFRIAAVYSNNDNTVSPISVRFHLNSEGGFESNRMPIPLLTHTEPLSASEVLLMWQNPDKTQNIDGFYIYYRASTSAGDYVKTTVEGKNSTNITISHLQPESTYEFKIQSFSVDAASEFSQILRAKTKKAVTLAEIPIEHLQPENEVNQIESVSKNSNVYITFGGVAGGLILICGLGVIGLAYKKKKQKQNHDSSQDQGKPISNGRMLNGGIHDSKVNITSNPLAGLESTEDPMQPKNLQPSMEMSSFLSPQNNNTGNLQNTSVSAANGGPVPAINGSALSQGILNSIALHSSRKLSPQSLRQTTRPIASH